MSVGCVFKLGKLGIGTFLFLSFIKMVIVCVLVSECRMCIG